MSKNSYALLLILSLWMNVFQLARAGIIPGWLAVVLDGAVIFGIPILEALLPKSAKRPDENSN